MEPDDKTPPRPIDWRMERSLKNLCGYCKGSPPDSHCNGSCFTREDFNLGLRNRIRKEYLEHELAAIPAKRMALEGREAQLEAELKKYEEDEEE